MAKIVHHASKGFQRYFLIGVLLILLALLITFISPFGIDLLIAGIIVTAVYPAHRWLLRKIHLPRSLTSLISMLLIILIVLMPFTIFGFFVVEQAADAYVTVSERINIIIATNDVSTTSKIIELIPYHDKFDGMLHYLPFTTADLLQTAKDAVGVTSTFLLSKTTNILKHLSLFLVHLLVFLLALYYFLLEGDKLVLYIRSLLPMSAVYRQELFSKLSKLSYGIIYGIFGAAILQGFLVGIGFAVAGIGSAAFWGAIAALFSPVPYIGTMVITLPAIILLAVGGKYITAVLLLLWCMLVVGSADNIIKPYIIGTSAHLHPLATLLVLLGGTFVFGIKGLLFGPLVLTLTLAFLHIYKLEYKTILEKEEGDIFPGALVKKVKIRKG